MLFSFYLCLLSTKFGSHLVLYLQFLSFLHHASHLSIAALSFTVMQQTLHNFISPNNNLWLFFMLIFLSFRFVKNMYTIFCHMVINQTHKRFYCLFVKRIMSKVFKGFNFDK